MSKSMRAGNRGRVAAGVTGGSAYERGGCGEPGRTRRREPGGAARGGRGTAGAPRGEAARAGWGRGRPAWRGPTRGRVRTAGAAVRLAAPCGVAGWCGVEKEEERKEGRAIRKTGLDANNHGVKVGVKIYDAKLDAKLKV